MTTYNDGFNAENMNSISNINSTFVRDKNGKKVYLFDEIRVYSTQGEMYETHCNGFCIHNNELCVLAMSSNYFFTPDHIEKMLYV